MAIYYTTPLGAGLKDGSDADNAFDWAAFVAFANSATGTIAPLDIVYFLGPSQTYTLTASVAFKNGDLATGYIKYIAVVDFDTLEWADEDDRPEVAQGAYNISTGSRAYWCNFKQTGTVSTTVTLGFDTIAYNCHITNTVEAGGNRRGFECSRSFVIGCTMIMGNNPIYTGTVGVAGDPRIFGCYIESTTGFVSATNIAFCIFNCSSTAGSISRYNQISNCTIYNSAVGLRLSSQGPAHYINLNIVNCDIGIKSNNSLYHQDNLVITNSNFYNNTIDVADSTDTDITASTFFINKTELDPQFVDAGGGNFGIGANLRNKGIPQKFNGLATTSYVDIGAVQINEFLPTVDEVLAGVKYGANGTELEGGLQTAVMKYARAYIPTNGSTFDTDEAEYQRENTEVSKKVGVLLEGLILGLDCNDNLATTAVIDRAGNQNGVANANTDTLTSVNAVEGSALAFTTAQGVSFADNANWDVESFTISMWIYYRAGRNNDQFFSRWVGTGNKRSFSFGVASSNWERLNLLIDSNGDNSGTTVLTASADGLVENTWTHIACTYTGGTGKLYVNGQPVATTGSVAVSVWKSDAPMLLNGITSVGTSAANAIYDIVSMYSVAKTDAEIEDIYDAQNEEFKVYPETTEIALPQIDSGANTTIWDMSTISTVVNPNGESGAVTFKYSIENTGTASYNATWLTLAELQAEADGTGRYLHIKSQLGGTTLQDATITDLSITANVATGGGSKPTVFFG